MKEQVFAELDKRVGKDLINAVHEVRTMFNLSHHEFCKIYTEWFNDQVTNREK